MVFLEHKLMFQSTPDAKHQKLNQKGWIAVKKILINCHTWILIMYMLHWLHMRTWCGVWPEHQVTRFIWIWSAQTEHIPCYNAILNCSLIKFRQTLYTNQPRYAQQLIPIEADPTAFAKLMGLLEMTRYLLCTIKGKMKRTERLLS